MKKKHGIFKKHDVINEAYKVEFYLGEDDVCEIYRVINLSKEVKLLKLIKPDFVSEIDLEKLSIRLETTSNINHANIIGHSKLLTFSLKGETYYYYILNYVSGENLDQLLNRNLRIETEQSCYIVLDVLRGIDFLHNLESPYLVGQISPNMIYLNYADNRENTLFLPLLVSHFLKCEKIHQQKIDYAYQENSKLIGEINISNDIYTISTLLYKMITGVFPWNYNFDWEDSSHQFIKNRIKLHREIYPFTKISDHIDWVFQDLEEIFSKSLDCNHEKKYKSIQELQQDLNKLVLKNYKFFQDNEIENFKDKLDSTQNIDKYEKDFGLSKIVGMKDLKKLLQEDIIQPLQEVERYKKYGIQPLNGILLYGPAGCGKTYIAQKLAEELDFYYIEIKPSDLASTYIHGTQEKIGQLFQRAKMEAPTLIFMDEVDAILPKRDLDSLNLHYAAEVNEFLAQMTDCMNNKILIVAATNRPEIIEPAILRTGRLDKSIYIGLPDFNTRLEILELELQTRPCTLDLDIHNLAIITTGYTSSDLKFLVNEVAKLALTQSDLISNEYFKTVTHKYRSSISKDQIEKYEQFKNKS